MGGHGSFFKNSHLSLFEVEVVDERQGIANLPYYIHTTILHLFLHLLAHLPPCPAAQPVGARDNIRLCRAHPRLYTTQLRSKYE